MQKDPMTFTPKPPKKGSALKPQKRRSTREAFLAYAEMSPEMRAIVDEKTALKRDSRTDPLTGLPNRRALIKHLKDVIRAGRRARYSIHKKHNLPLRQDDLRAEMRIASTVSNRKNVIVFVDLKGFKSVNDIYGQQAGDNMLCAIAKTLNRQKRPNDYVARLGGDEFVFILNAVDPKDITALTKRLEDAVSKTSIMAAGEEVFRGCHIGFHAIEEHETAHDIKAMINQADKNRLEKKRSDSPDTEKSAPKSGLVNKPPTDERLAKTPLLQAMDFEIFSQIPPHI